MRQDGWIEVTRRWLTVLSMQKSAFTGDPTAACGQRMSEFVTVESSSCTNCNHCHYAAFAIAETTDKVRWGEWTVNGTKFKISTLKLLQNLLHLNEIPHKLSTTELAQKSGGRLVPLSSTLTIILRCSFISVPVLTTPNAPTPTNDPSAPSMTRGTGYFLTTIWKVPYRLLIAMYKRSTNHREEQVVHPCPLFTKLFCWRFKNALEQTNAIPLEKITALICFFLIVVFHISETNVLLRVATSVNLSN